MSEIIPGIYDRIIDFELDELIKRADLQPILRLIDDEESPSLYATFLSQVLKKSLSSLEPKKRVFIFNQIIELISNQNGLEEFKSKRIQEEGNTKLFLSTNKNLPRPITPLYISSLLTGQGNDPPLEHEIRAELISSDRVDILISFVKWSGLRLLLPSFEELEKRNVPVRIISTSYMGVSEPEALKRLSEFKNISIRVSLDKEHTRLHAKAYHFHRKSGFSTAYIGSANMTYAAMTSGLEWTVKVTAQDMPHILERFTAEFETYWENKDYVPLKSEADLQKFQNVIQSFKTSTQNTIFFAEITPRLYQERILEEIQFERENENYKNLIIAATGTGKTVISAFDYIRYCQTQKLMVPLLYVAHRKEILDQAMACFRLITKDQNFGEFMGDGENPFARSEVVPHVFATVQSINSQKLWEKTNSDFFQFLIIDEVHHGTASSYRNLFDRFSPKVLVGLTATPERMDGESILPDFNYRITSEIRLAEALEEKLLCPFHYFGISDNIKLTDDKFWKNGKYDIKEIENVYTADHIDAKQRIDLINKAIQKYQPNQDTIKAIGFCVSVKHAKYMAEAFQTIGFSSEFLVGETESEKRKDILRSFRSGKIKILFTVDLFNEGIDIPEINTVLFLRPTESLTIFLQQLGRGLRHFPNKDCLTVLDFIGMTHKKYRIDRKFASLLKRTRGRLLEEAESEFPSLPSGSAIQLERVARDEILTKIREVYANLNHLIPEWIQTWDTHISGELNFSNFIQETSVSAISILKKYTWSEWKNIAQKLPQVSDPDITKGKKTLLRICQRTSPTILNAFIDIADGNDFYIQNSLYLQTSIHYLIWGEPAQKIGFQNWKDSLDKWKKNQSLVNDAKEIASWALKNYHHSIKKINLPFPCELELHASFGSIEIKAGLGLATIESPGQTGTGVLHDKRNKFYVHLVTFQKEEKDFSTTTMYKDYPISRTKLHWESQGSVSLTSETARNYLNFESLGYTILFFARIQKQIEGETSPFLFLGPAKSLLSYEGEKPISMVWELEYPMPAKFFEESKPL